jgi:ribonuclease D
MSETPDNQPPASQAGANQSRRSHHRARSHESAHAETDGGHDGHIFKHPLVAQSPAEMVSTPAQLANLLSACRAAGSFAFDTEFIGEQSYFPHLCLIQIALTDRVALVDPLGGADGKASALDVNPFWDLVCDPSVEKIVHAGQQDLEPTFRLLGKHSANVLDTQVCAGFVGLPYPLSLSKLIGELVGARLGKGLTFTSWDQRPLSSQQAHYAADDVRYLPAARAELRTRLEREKHTAWAAEECAELCKTASCRFDPDENYLKVRGAGGLEPVQLAVLRELAIWRDAAARTADVPPRTFLKDEVLLSLARSPARSLEKLSRIRGLPRPVESEHGERIVAMTQAVYAKPRSELPDGRQPEPAPREKFLCDRAWAVGQAACFDQSIDPALVTSRQEIGELWNLVHHKGDPATLRLMQGWRRAAIGERIVEMMKARR